MKTLKKIGIGLLALVVLLVVVAFLLPSKIHVERSAQMKTSPEQIYNLVSDFKSWKEWSPWHKMDPNMQITWGDKSEGMGASYSWKSENDKVGTGKSEIVEAVPNEKLKMEMFFMESKNPAYGGWTFEKNEEGVKVTNSMDMDAGMNPMMRIMGAMMDGMVGKHFEDGLNSLKAIVESGSDENKIAGFASEMRDLDKMIIAGIREKVKVSAINGELFGSRFGSIGGVLTKAKMEPAGAPMAVYYSYDKENCDMEISMPVKAMGKDEGNVKFHELAATKALVVKYFGDYAKTEPIYSAAAEYMAKNNLKENGYPMEMYITDPMTEKDTAKWLTEIVFPVK